MGIRQEIRIEGLFWGLFLGIQVFYLRNYLFFNTATLLHDNSAWVYPAFQFVGNSILNGQLPLWNPYSHAGEPFYPILGQVRLMEPLLLAVLYLGHFLTDDLVRIYNWYRYLVLFIHVLGVYGILRMFCVNLYVRLALIPLLLLSSFFFGSFQQDGILHQFMWVPFVTYSFLQVLYFRKRAVGYWMMMAGGIGLSFQSYWFSGMLTYLCFFVIGFAVFRRSDLVTLCRSPGFIPRLGCLMIVLVAMAAPNIVLMAEQENYVFPARFKSSETGHFMKEGKPLGSPHTFEGSPGELGTSVKMTYAGITQFGTFLSLGNFYQLISPNGNEAIHFLSPARKWGRTSEAYLYFGILGWLLILNGICFGKHELKRVFAFVLVVFSLLALGPVGGLHQWLYYVFPPLWFLRHTHTFVMFIELCLLYFFVLGLNQVVVEGFIQSRINKESNIFDEKSPLKRTHKPAPMGKAHWGPLDVIRVPTFALAKVGGAGVAKATLRTPSAEDASQRTFLPKIWRFVYATLYRIRSARIGRSAIVFVLVLYSCMKGVYALQYPYSNFAMCVLGPLGGIAYLLRNKLSRSEMFYSIIVCHLLFVFSIRPQPHEMIPHLFLAGLVPIFVCRYAIRREQILGPLTGLLLLAFLTGDLLFALGEASALYDYQKNPAGLVGAKTKLGKIEWSDRQIVLRYPDGYEARNNPVRFLETLTYQPTVFSTLYGNPKIPDANAFAFARSHSRYNTFYLSKRYFELVHSNESSDTLYHWFAIGRFPFWCGTEASITLDEFRLNRAKVTVNTPVAQDLIWSDGFNPHWQADVDGRPSEVESAFGAFKRVTLSPGSHEVVFRFFPLAYLIAVGLFYAGFLICLLGVWPLFQAARSGLFVVR